MRTFSRNKCCLFGITYPKTAKPIYPDRCARGLSQQLVTIFHGEELVGNSAFQFQQSNKNKELLECSINWVDDPGAINQIQEETKPNGYLKYQHGIVCIRRVDIDQSNNRWIQRLTYNRDILPDNPYHGNLIIPREYTAKRVMRALQSALVELARSDLC